MLSPDAFALDVGSDGAVPCVPASAEFIAPCAGVMLLDDWPATAPSSLAVIGVVAVPFPAAAVFVASTETCGELIVAELETHLPPSSDVPGRHALLHAVSPSETPASTSDAQREIRA